MRGVGLGSGKREQIGRGRSVVRLGSSRIARDTDSWLRDVELCGLRGTAAAATAATSRQTLRLRRVALFRAGVSYDPGCRNDVLCTLSTTIKSRALYT